MSCQERRDTILLYVADALDADERDELRAHLATGCPCCTGAFAEARAVLALLPQALPPEAPSPSVRERLMRQIAVTAVAPAETVTPAGAPRARRPAALARYTLGRMFAVAVSAAAVAAVVTGIVLWAPSREGRRLVEARDLRMVQLGGAGPAADARGRIFWDPQHNDWQVYVFDLKPPTPGRTYELWFITKDGAKVAAGTFDVTPQGRGSIKLPLPPNVGPQLAAAAITDEPIGGSSQPTGQIRLLGKIE